MVDPLSRVAFDCTFADRLDVAARTAAHLPALRAQRRHGALFLGRSGAALTAVLLWTLRSPDGSAPARAATVALTGVLGFALGHARHPAGRGA